MGPGTDCWPTSNSFLPFRQKSQITPIDSARNCTHSSSCQLDMENIKLPHSGDSTANIWKEEEPASPVSCSSLAGLRDEFGAVSPSWTTSQFSAGSPARSTSASILIKLFEAEKLSLECAPAALTWRLRRRLMPTHRLPRAPAHSRPSSTTLLRRRKGLATRQSSITRPVHTPGPARLTQVQAGPVAVPLQYLCPTVRPSLPLRASQGRGRRPPTPNGGRFVLRGLFRTSYHSQFAALH